jgi:hypothetical protein
VNFWECCSPPPPSSSSSIGFRRLTPQDVPQPAGFCTTLCFGSSHSHRQAPPRLQRRERPLAGKVGTMGEKWPACKRSLQWRLTRHCRDLICGMGPTSRPK